MVLIEGNEGALGSELPKFKSMVSLFVVIVKIVYKVCVIYNYF